MAGLIDHIFENIDIERLSRSEVKSYTMYISEIFFQNLTVEQKVRYQRIKVNLNERLIELDKQELDKQALDKQKFKKELTAIYSNTDFLLGICAYTQLAF